MHQKLLHAYYYFKIFILICRRHANETFDLKTIQVMYPRWNVKFSSCRQNKMCSYKIYEPNFKYNIIVLLINVMFTDVWN